MGGATVGMVVFRTELQLVLSRIILWRGMTSTREKKGSMKESLYKVKASDLDRIP